MNLRLTGVALVCSACAFFVGRWSAPLSSIPTTVSIGAEEAGLSGEFARISREDLDDYRRLKGDAEKFRKADEILGKIIQLFLADLGLHVSPKRFPTLKVLAESDLAGAESAPTPKIAPTVKQTEAQSKSAGTTQSWKVAEARIAAVTNDQEGDALLKSARIPDLLTEIRSSSPVDSMDSTLAALISGKYSGDITLQDGTPPWQATFSVSGSIEGGKFMGTETIQLSKNGQPFSTSNGQGNLEGFRRFASGSSALLVQSGDHYFQLYYVPNEDAFIGNVYGKSPSATFPCVGTVKLNRL